MHDQNIELQQKIYMPALQLQLCTACPHSTVSLQVHLYQYCSSLVVVAHADIVALTCFASGIDRHGLWPSQALRSLGMQSMDQLRCDTVAVRGQCTVAVRGQCFNKNKNPKSNLSLHSWHEKKHIPCAIKTMVSFFCAVGLVQRCETTITRGNKQRKVNVTRVVVVGAGGAVLYTEHGLNLRANFGGILTGNPRSAIYDMSIIDTGTILTKKKYGSLTYDSVRSPLFAFPINIIVYL